MTDAALTFGRLILLVPILFLHAACVPGAIQASGQSAEIPILTAQPNPVPAGTHLGTTRITWRTVDGEEARITVSVDGGAEALFASGVSGSQEAPWIQTGLTYEFRLSSKARPDVPLASAVVTRRDDGHRALVFAAIALLGLLLATIARPAWFLELVPVVVIVLIMWVKLVEMTTHLRSGPADSDRAVLQSTLAVLLVLSAILVAVPRRFRVPAALAFDLMVTLVAYADLLHFRFFGDITSISDVAFAGQLVWVTPSITTLLRPGDMLYFVEIAVGVLLVRSHSRACRDAPSLRLLPRAVLGAVCTAAGVLLFVAGRGPAVFESREVLLVDRLSISGKIGVLPFHLYDAASNWAYPTSAPLHVGPTEREEVRRFFARPAPVRTSSLHGSARGRNVILISLESLNAFPLGLRVDDQDVTPHLSAFARESLSFTNFFDQTYLGRTSDAEFLALQSLHPVAAGTVSTRFSRNTFRALPTLLRDRGYTTLSAVGASGGAWNMSQMHPRLGFERSYFDDSFVVRERVGAWMSDADFFEQVVPILSSAREPLMSFLLTSSTHHPFKVPEERQLLALQALKGTQLGDYLQAVHSMDAAFGAFVSALRSNGLLDRSIVALYGDHYALVRPFPHLSSVLRYPEASGFHEFRVVKNVPFMIRLPDGQGAGVRANTGGHVDVAPTLLSLLGVDNEREMFLGNDLTLGEDSLVVFRDGGFVDGRHFFVAERRRGSGATCYEAATARYVNCASLEEIHRAALERLRISDLIVQGDLIPAVHTELRTRAAPRGPPAAR